MTIVDERSTLADLAAHEHASGLEAALDYAMLATRRASNPSHAIDTVTVARLKLATSATREAFYADSKSLRRLGIDEAITHLEAAIDDLQNNHVGHPARHALQFLNAVQDGESE